MGFIPQVHDCITACKKLELDEETLGFPLSEEHVKKFIPAGIMTPEAPDDFRPFGQSSRPSSWRDKHGMNKDGSKETGLPEPTKPFTQAEPDHQSFIQHRRPTGWR
jgi:hypothetical protein